MSFKSLCVAFTLTIFCTLSFQSAQGQKNNFTIESGSIPPDFNQNNDTLLIWSSNPFYAGSMRKHFRKGGYTGVYETTTNAGKYSMEHARFILYELTGSTRITNIGGPAKGQSRTMVQTQGFYIHDRKTQKNYATDLIPSPKNIQAYVGALEGARKL